jgi:hypothetical protein
VLFWLVYKGRNHIVVLFQVSERLLLGLRISGLVVHGFSQCCLRAKINWVSVSSTKISLLEAKGFLSVR